MKPEQIVDYVLILIGALLVYWAIDSWQYDHDPFWEKDKQEAINVSERLMGRGTK
jgi:nitrogen fixation-related uncharacterized protein